MKKGMAPSKARRKDIVNVTSEQLRQLQRICLEMLLEVDRICRKNDVSYSLAGGTLLGAVRHGGFIPWDDDVDVIMTRKEYNRFREACRAELDEERFFLQDYTTDPAYRWGYAKLRRKGTTQIRAGQEHLLQHGGVFIDIFVTDNVPNGAIARTLHYGICFLIRKLQYSPIGAVNEPSLLKRVGYGFLLLFPRELSFAIRDGLAEKCNKKETELVSHYTFPNPKRAKYGMPSCFFNEFTDIEFDSHTVRCFKEYDAYLKLWYGDYMTLPPESERFSHVLYSSLDLIEVDI